MARVGLLAQGRGRIASPWGRLISVIEAEYDRALSYLFASLEGLSSPQLMQSVVAAGSDSRTSGEQLLKSLRALRNELAHLDRTRASLVLDQINESVGTEDGEPIRAVNLELSFGQARAVGRSRLDLSEEGEDLQQVVALMDALIADLVEDGADDGPI